MENSMWGPEASISPENCSPKCEARRADLEAEGHVVRLQGGEPAHPYQLRVWGSTFSFSSAIRGGDSGADSRTSTPRTNPRGRNLRTVAPGRKPPRTITHRTENSGSTFSFSSAIRGGDSGADSRTLTPRTNPRGRNPRTVAPGRKPPRTITHRTEPPAVFTKCEHRKNFTPHYHFNLQTPPVEATNKYKWS